MNRAISASLAKKIDKYSIENGMPGLVLMERAALEVADYVHENIFADKYNRDYDRAKREENIIAVCQVGNNGADGVAAMRILSTYGYNCHVCVIGDMSKATEEFGSQIQVISHYENISVDYLTDCISEDYFAPYTTIIDAIFGVGLSRDITGLYAQVINRINEANKLVVAVDISSGIDSNDGHIHGVAVRADYTVTFGYAKLGHLLFPGKEYRGRLVVKQMGFLPDIEPLLDGEDWAYYHENIGLPKRAGRTNKGDYGKPLIIAGSKDMTGAVFMSAMAAYRTGAGVVSVLTHNSIDPYCKSVLPEAIVKSYGDEDTYNQVKTILGREDIIVLGPGLSTTDTAREVVRAVLDNAVHPVIVDADALNIISTDTSLLQHAKTDIIITPHIGEMARLTNKPSRQIIENVVETAREFARDYQVICVLKDAVTVVASPDGRTYLTTAGNPGMATAGSGDVLTGVLAAVCGAKDPCADLFEKVCLGTQIHALSGDVAADKVGEYSLMARDIIEGIIEVLH